MEYDEYTYYVDQCGTLHIHIITYGCELSVAEVDDCSKMSEQELIEMVESTLEDYGYFPREGSDYE